MTSIKFRALTHDDHKLFFEALGEHGKDFHNIQQYMAQKGGKNSNKTTDQNKSIDPQERKEREKKEDDKKREQIRNFYNKLYTKLSQFIDCKIDDRVEKVYQELYLLINYGEIWKKHGFKFNDKTKKMLKELVNRGYTTYRSKNKNVRLRTPPCKALKKINEIGVDEKVKVVTTRELPKDVIVEFHPATNLDWLKVQSMSQNPRVRARLSIQKRLSTIIEYLERKWGITMHNNMHYRLRLKPSATHELKEVNITRVIPDNHLDLSLNAYIKQLGECPEKNQVNEDKVANNININQHFEHSQSILPESCTSDQPSIAQARKHLNLLQSLTGSLENSRLACEDEDAVMPVPILPMVEHTVSQNSKSFDLNIPDNLTLGDFFKMADGGGDEANDGFPVEPSDVESKKSPEDPRSVISNPPVETNNHLIEIQKFAEGWTKLGESSITIGELYLAFKCPEKIILEYGFESDTDPPSNNLLIFKLLTAASLSLANLERQKQEQMHKSHDQQACSKLKKRKGSGPTMTLHDIEVINQRVEEALKKLQPTRLSSYRRAR